MLSDGNSRETRISVVIYEMMMCPTYGEITYGLVPFIYSVAPSKWAVENSDLNSLRRYLFSVQIWMTAKVNSI
jgi:hypothetical protein